MPLVFWIFTSCNNKTAPIIEYTYCEDTISEVSYANVSGFYEDTSGIYCYFKPYGLDTVFLFKENELGHFVLDASFKIPAFYKTFAEIDEISQVVFINKDSLILFHPHNITLWDIKQDSLVANYYHSDFDTSYRFLFDRGTWQLEWNSHRKTLLLFLIDYSDKPNRKWICDTKYLAEFSFEKMDISIVPLKYPFSLYNDILLLSSTPYEDPLFTFNGDTIVTAFPLGQTMCIYDIKNNHTDSLEVKERWYIPIPRPDTARIRKISHPNYLFESALENNYFDAVEYDKYNDVYYRFFQKALPKKNEKGLLNTDEDKIYGVTVLDKGLKMIGSATWKANRFGFYYPTSKGLYSLKSLANNSSIIVRKIKLHYEK